MSNVFLTVIGFSIIFLATSLGSALVFFFRSSVSGKTDSALLGLAGGIMVAASVWSLLIPAIESSVSFGNFAFIPAAVGFLLGGGFLVLLDKVIPQKGFNMPLKGDNERSKKTFKLFLAITIHNIPEGLAVGFAFGGAAALKDPAYSALGLAIGIAVQNFPEGAAVSLPLKSGGVSKGKAFLFGALSGAVEPIAAVIGYFLATFLTVCQPWLLSFAAGAMVFVVIEDLVPDSHNSESTKIATWGFMIGFTVMMILDVALG